MRLEKILIPISSGSMSRVRLLPQAQRFMSDRAGSTVVEVAGSHAVYMSQPNAVAAIIEKAAGEAAAS